MLQLNYPKVGHGCYERTVQHHPPPVVLHRLRRPADIRNTFEKFLAEDCCYGDRLKDRDAILRWLLGDPYDARDAANSDGFWPEGSEDLAAIVRIVPDLKRAAASEDLVFIERVDHHYDAKGQDAIISHLVAVMEIRNGKIATWRDYSANDPEL